MDTLKINNVVYENVVVVVVEKIYK